MFKINLIKLTFGLKAFSTAITALLVNCFEDRIPIFVSKIFRYGKFSSNAKVTFIEKCEVPKRWFKHFYIFAGPFSTMSLVSLYYKFFFNGKLPGFVIWFLSYFLGIRLQSSPLAENVVLAMTIFTIHCWKRFYETHYVNVFSKQYMNISIYLIGLYHYFGTVLSIVGETSILTIGSKVILNWTKLSWLDYLCSIIFLLATYVQFKSNVILANLRKDSKGVIVTEKYKIPQGGLFEYVTAPLQLLEIIMYLCLSLILRDASTFHYVTIWVIINQVECAYLSHQWFLKTFKNYPKSRKIIIPFLI